MLDEGLKFPTQMMRTNLGNKWNSYLLFRQQSLEALFKKGL